jgi:NAD(P)-dependent dehydrogenase (short-subunit alcohol dehydrogenase family)
MKRLSGKVAVVTGAARGIGAAIAVAFAKEGADVVINYLSHRAEADAVAKEVVSLGVKAWVIQADVSKRVDIQRLFEQTLQHAGRIDV